ncbi:outer membrane protein assembly factor BamB family protein [Crateriforma spongiae]|uniref:outer membrane protein assembly factor BamB family protein n=1 Tax=Crateriforma spongiae TaxID=2724528 RepID=UPI001446525B|nr:PQQ-binding-like beta-propeller repeat protein [Crateriforma spongiae]
MKPICDPRRLYRIRLAYGCLLISAVLAKPSHTLLAADTWGSFRAGGASTAASPLPVRWSENQSIAWQQELMGYGQSAPVIYGGRLVVTSVEGSGCETLVVTCLDLRSGETLWMYRHRASATHPSTYMYSRAAPTPVVDANGVYAFFESGDFLGLDWSGQLRWHRNEAEAFGKFGNNHGIGSSPAADDHSLYLLIEHDGPSSLVSISKETGQTQWSVDRPSVKSWASPIVANVDGRHQVVVSSGGSVCGYRTDDGSALWQLDGLDGNTVPSPVASGNRLLIPARLPEFAADGQVKANCCLDLSNISDGSPAVLWRADKAISEYASPVVCGDFAYFINKASVLHCIHVKTGEVAYRKRLSLDCWATPIVAGDLIYFFAKNGQAKVIRSGDTYDEVAVNSLWDPLSPPLPTHYVESTAAQTPHHGHASVGETTDADTNHHAAQQRHGGDKPHDAGARPAGGMLARLMAGDKNDDGILEGDEIPGMFRSMLSRVDDNGDGRLDSDELKAMAKSFAERRADAAASARDPIVYGVAAADGRIAIRTGTRMYVIADEG